MCVCAVCVRAHMSMSLSAMNEMRGCDQFQFLESCSKLQFALPTQTVA